MRYAISAAGSPRPSSTIPAAGRVSSADPVLRVQHQLTVRDLLLLDWLADHQVLTTPQIDNALFGSPRATQRRLLDLHHLGLTDRFRPLRPGGGSYPWHHVLGHTGAALIAAARDQPPPRPIDTTHRIRRTSTSRTLTHTLGINQFFTDLAAHTRTHPDTHLDRWWSERRCAAPGAFAPALISPIRPDGHGLYREHGHTVAFYLEYDTGSEYDQALATKLARYTTHIAKGGPAWPVLFRLSTTGRERHLHQLLTGVRLPVTIATTSPDTLDAGDPAEACWLLHGQPPIPRRLIDLADHQRTGS
jgi:hypothetical protein